ncbi:disease resistance protein [Striga asiatica]|uniref:Disease resistance protein n=1 Tax=Striga asiatica TaxID=4170 RepID=A0A5A7Q8W6_STRAF|nr:disease resistance protein [Striga asiatica]
MNLSHYEDRKIGSDNLSWSCLTICQMIAEAVRFPPILNRICFGFDGPGLALNRMLVKFQTNYVKMCKNLAGHSIIERLQYDHMSLVVFNSVAIMKEVAEMMLINDGENTATSFIITTESKTTRGM